MYNALSEVVKIIDPLNFATQYVYDKLGRQVQTLYPDGSSVSMSHAYDLINGGYTETVVDQMNGQTITRYDKAVQLVKRTNALGYFKKNYQNQKAPFYL